MEQQHDFQDFQGERVSEIAQKLFFPRLFGSEGSKKARMIIKEELESYGYNEDAIRSDIFFGSYSQIYYVVMIFSFIILSFTAILALNFLSIKYCRISVLFFIPLIYILNELLNRFRVFSAPTVSSHVGENIYVNLQPKRKRACTLVIMANFDSKSSLVSVGCRKKLNYLVFLGSVIFPSFAFMFSFFDHSNYDVQKYPKYFEFLSSFSISYLHLILIFLFLFFNICLIFLIFGVCCISNKSSGIIDNGTSVSLLLELSRIFKDELNRPDFVELVFLYTDGEGLGALGSSCFISKYFRKFDIDTTYVLNLRHLGLKNSKIGVEESIGFLKSRYICNSKLKEYIMKSSKKMSNSNKSVVEFYHENSNVFYSDHIPFIQFGLNCVMIRSLPNSENEHFLKFLNTEKDTVDLLCLKKLDEAGNLLTRIVKIIDEDFGKIK